MQRRPRLTWPDRSVVEADMVTSSVCPSVVVVMHLFFLHRRNSVDSRAHATKLQEYPEAFTAPAKLQVVLGGPLVTPPSGRITDSLKTPRASPSTRSIGTKYCWTESAWSAHVSGPLRECARAASSDACACVESNAQRRTRSPPSRLTCALRQSSHRRLCRHERTGFGERHRIRESAANKTSNHATRSSR